MEHDSKFQQELSKTNDIKPNSTSFILPNPNLLDKLDFEDKSFIISLYSSISKPSTEDLISPIFSFNSIYISTTILNISTQIPDSSNWKIIKIFSWISQYSDKFWHWESSQTAIHTDINLLIHNCFLIWYPTDEDLFNTGTAKELDTITETILGMAINVSLFSFDNFCEMISANCSKGESNLNWGERHVWTSGSIYDKFQSSFRVLIYFYWVYDKFCYIYSIVGQSEDKVMTAELVVCWNKIIRNWNDEFLFCLILKKYLENIDTKRITLSKEDFFKLIVKAVAF